MLGMLTLVGRLLVTEGNLFVSYTWIWFLHNSLAWIQISEQNSPKVVKEKQNQKKSLLPGAIKDVGFDHYNSDVMERDNLREHPSLLTSTCAIRSRKRSMLPVHSTKKFPLQEISRFCWPLEHHSFQNPLKCFFPNKLRDPCQQEACVLMRSLLSPWFFCLYLLCFCILFEHLVLLYAEMSNNKIK